MRIYSRNGKHERKDGQFAFSRYEFYAMVALMAFAIIVGMIFMAAYSDFKEPEVEEPQATQEIEEKPLEREKTASESILEPIKCDYLGDDISSSPIKPKPNIIDEEVPMVEEIHKYSEEEIMAVTNMVFGEIGGIIYDKNLTEDQKDLVLQEWARIPLNHVNMGLADNLQSLMNVMTGGGYYIWHPQYGTEWYRDQSIKQDAARYERCRANVEKALNGKMSEQVPENVIYADVQIHGSGVYKQYNLDTGWFRSTVYLCFA